MTVLEPEGRKEKEELLLRRKIELIDGLISNHLILTLYHGE